MINLFKTYMTRTFKPEIDTGVFFCGAVASISYPSFLTLAGTATASSMTRTQNIISAIAIEVIAFTICTPNFLKK